MPSFDVVSEVDGHELTNAVNQANREIANRYDFKGSNAKVVQENADLCLEGQSEFQLDQIHDILVKKMARRGIDVNCMQRDKVEETNMRARQLVAIRQGIDREVATKIAKLVKGSKLKVQTAIQGNKLRIIGKKRDDLQKAITILKDADLGGLPLQFNNFRD